MFIFHPTALGFMQRGCLQTEVGSERRRDVESLLDAAAFLPIREFFFILIVLDVIFISEQQVKEKGNPANLSEIRSYLCLLSIREITSRFFATTGKELALESIPERNAERQLHSQVC